MITLDCRGQQCPHPVIQTRKAILSDPGQTVRVLVDDTTVQENVSRLATSLGYSITAADAGESIQLDLTKTGTADTVSSEKASGPTIVYISSDQVGHGDQKLGQILLKNFIFTLTEGAIVPDAIYFVNTGVKLAVGGSDLIEPLEKLASQGVDIASCGLCLEFFGLKEALAIGRISNMLELINAMETAGRIIQP